MIPWCRFKMENENLKILLDAYKYEEYVWQVIGNFNMVAFLMDSKSAQTSFFVIFEF